MRDRPDPAPTEPTEEPSGARAGAVYIRLSPDRELVELVLELPPHVALGLAEQLRDAARRTPELLLEELIADYNRCREAGRTGAEREPGPQEPPSARTSPPEPEVGP